MENNSKITKFDRILESAIKIIGQRGFHVAKVKDIAGDAGVADGTIYNYFNNKEDILITIFRVKLEEYVKKALFELSGGIPADEKIKILVKYHIKVMTENPYLANVFQIELRQPMKEVRVKVRKHLRDYFKLIENVIEDGIKDKIFSADLDVYLAREMFFGSLDEIISTWVFKGFDRDLNNMASNITPMLLKAFK